MRVAVGSGRGVNVLRGTNVGNGSGVLGVPEAQAVKTKTNAITANIALTGFIFLDPQSHKNQHTEKIDSAYQSITRITRNWHNYRPAFAGVRGLRPRPPAAYLRRANGGRWSARPGLKGG